MAKLMISLAQMPIVAGDVQRNRRTMAAMVSEAAKRRSRLIVLPELWSTGYDLPHANEQANELNTGVFTDMSTAATKAESAVVGSVLEKRGREVSNTAAVFAPNGQMLGVYRKLHLFRLLEEDRYLQPGPSLLTLDLPWGPTGFAICYDLRFPEMFRRYTIDNHVKMIIIPAEWPLARIEHWRALLIARAIENQCYVVACNTAGESGGAVYGGHSMIVDPWGKIVVEAGETPQLITAEIELDTVDEVRRKIPVFEDLRLDIYG